MLSIRLSRTGKRKQPLYRLIVTEKSRDPWGTFLENLGTYNPRTKPSTLQVKADRIKDWIAKGAQCSDTVWNLLLEEGIVKGEKRTKVHLTKQRREKIEKNKPQPKEEPKKEEAPAAEAPKAEEPAPEEAKPAEEPKAEESKEEAAS